MPAGERIAVDIGGLTPRRIASLFACSLKELRGALVKLADFERFASSVPTVQGDRYAIDPYQRLVLLAYFLGFTEVLTLIPKGNGKTSLLALLMVYHLLTTPVPEVVAGASIRDQAGKIYREACRIAALPRNLNGGNEAPWRVPDPDGTVREVWLRTLPGYREIRLGRKPEDGNMLVLASDKYDSGSLEGIGPTLGVCEELHAHKTDAIYAAIQGALHKRPGQNFGISTAGKRLDSLLGDIRSTAFRRGVVTRVPEFGFLRVARDGRDSIVFEWAILEGADYEDMSVVKGANPATFVTIEALRGLRRGLGMTVSRWKRNHCGLWTAEDEGWLDGRGEWDANGVDERLQDGDEIVLGVDPAWSYDTFSIVGLKITGDRKAFAEPIEILRPKKGQTVSHRQIKAALVRALERFRVTAMGYDRNRGFAHIVEELSDEHSLNCIAISMRGDVWVPLTAELRAAIDDGSWTHPGDEIYTAHVLSGEVKATHEGERLHGRTQEKVDALMATGIAWHTAFGAAADDEIYRDRDLITSGDDDEDLDDDVDDWDDDGEDLEDEEPDDDEDLEDDDEEDEAP
jgi:phage terminase large subunit-like protein